MDEIPAEEITITLIRDRKPVKLLQKLSSDGYECRKETAGIYYVSGVMFPVQIIASSELDMDLHVQLKALTDNLDEPLMWKYLQEVSVFTEREKNLADVVLQVIVNSNMEKVQKWKGSEGQIRAYATLVKDGIITVEVGAEKAGMSVDDFTKEMKQAGYVIPAV